VKKGREVVQSDFHSKGLPAAAPGELKGKLIVVEGTDGVGRSTHIVLLREWLENNGHAVLVTRMGQSVLAGKGLRAAKKGHTLSWITMSLFYTTDFADRLENEIIPALRAGFVVLTDRYIYSLMARAIVRGADSHWIENVYEFAPKPDIIIYLRTNIEALITRVVQTGGFNYWESGMDLRLGEDMYDSFVVYQGRLLTEFDRMAVAYGFQVFETSGDIEQVSERLKDTVRDLLEPEDPPREAPAENVQCRDDRALSDIDSQPLMEFSSVKR
jgi:dTMP kinase